MLNYASSYCQQQPVALSTIECWIIDLLTVEYDACIGDG